MSNVRDMPPPPPSPTAALVAQLARDLPYLLEYEVINAQLRRARYVASIEQGFSEAQALELCR